MASEKDTRTRNWTFVLYPESAPEQWRDVLDELHTEWIESPLHEFDTNPTGEIKKAHYHILVMFGGVKSFEQVQECIAPLNCPIPQRCHNVRSMVRYMAHLDNPEKHQYSPGMIIGHGGVDPADYMRPSAAQRYDLIREMCKYIGENHICEFQDLMDYCMQEHFDDWFPLLCDNSAYVVGEYIKSQRYRSRDQ